MKQIVNYFRKLLIKRDLQDLEISLTFQEMRFSDYLKEKERLELKLNNF